VNHIGHEQVQVRDNRHDNTKEKDSGPHGQINEKKSTTQLHQEYPKLNWAEPQVKKKRKPKSNQKKRGFFPTLGIFFVGG
jgi:hypothetical protein